MNKNKENIQNNNENVVKNTDFITKKKIKYIPYFKNSILKHNFDIFTQRKKNENKQVISEDNKNIMDDYFCIYNNNNNNKINRREILLNNSSTNCLNNPSAKNLFYNRINLSNYRNYCKKNKIKRHHYFANLSVGKVIFNKKKHNNNLSLTEKSIKDKIMKNNSTLPDLNTHNSSKFKKKKLIEKKFYFRAKTMFDEKMKNYRAKSVSSEYIYNKKSLNKNISKNNYTASASVFTNSTKQIKANKSTNFCEDLRNYRLGLLSGGSSTYNNVLIPIISIKRPIYNLNKAEDKKRNKSENNNNNKHNTSNNKNEIKEDNKPFEAEDSFLQTNNNSLNIIKNNFIKIKQKKKDIVSESEHNSEIICNNVEKLISKFHKIKIEKGMMNKKIANSLSKKLFISYYNQHKNINKFPLRFNNERKRNIIYK